LAVFSKSASVGAALRLLATVVVVCVAGVECVGVTGVATVGMEMPLAAAMASQ
jgi:hypothetical protein